MHALLLLIICSPMEGLKVSPFSKPRNFPFPSVPDTSAQDGPVERAFPVINVRFTYPPSMVDPRRKLALAESQAALIDTCVTAAVNMDDDATELFKHATIQRRTADMLTALPTSGNSEIQNYYMRLLADQIPDVGTPRLSLIEVPKNPQINIAIEDNQGAFESSTGTSPAKAARFAIGINREWAMNRKLMIEIVKINIRRIEILEQFLRERIRKGLKLYVERVRTGSFMEVAADVGDQSDRGGWGDGGGRGDRGDQDEQEDQRDQSGLKDQDYLLHDGEQGSDVDLLQMGIDDDIQPTNSTGNATEPHIDEDEMDVTSFAGNATDMTPADLPIVMALRARVMEGGRSAGKALAGLVDLWNEHQGARESIRKSMVLIDCRLLLMNRKTPDYVKNLAGTLITLASGAPVAVSAPDFNSGSFGHVNIIIPRPSRVYLPDKQIALATGGDYLACFVFLSY